MARYVSPLREAQAAQTRERVLDAAVAIFRSSGYSGASLAQIARTAGVSVETVKQLGPKASLLLSAFGHAFTGVDNELPLSQQSGLEWIRALPDVEFTAGWLGFVADANTRVAQLWPRLLEAASSDDEVGTRLAALQSNRRADMDSVIALLRERGLCRSARDDADLAAELSFLISPESYTQLVLDSGWSEDAYRAWLGRAVDRMILQP
ncbi:MAG TPA: TetR family transcriptional regulator [Microbacterium sp.]|nr:TetR family transcriptional regulator [Microbacterium sp.]